MLASPVASGTALRGPAGEPECDSYQLGKNMMVSHARRSVRARVIHVCMRLAASGSGGG